MHDGCSGSFNDGIEVVEKLRMMGFSSQPMPLNMNVLIVEWFMLLHLVTHLMLQIY